MGTSGVASPVMVEDEVHASVALVGISDARDAATPRRSRPPRGGRRRARPGGRAAGGRSLAWMTSPAPATADVAVVGGGILGLACAAELLRRRPGCKLVAPREGGRARGAPDVAQQRGRPRRDLLRARLAEGAPVPRGRRAAAGLLRRPRDPAPRGGQAHRGELAGRPGPARRPRGPREPQRRARRPAPRRRGDRRDRAARGRRRRAALPAHRDRRLRAGRACARRRRAAAGATVATGHEVTSVTPRRRRLLDRPRPRRAGDRRGACSAPAPGPTASRRRAARHPTRGSSRSAARTCLVRPSARSWSAG